MIGHLSHPGGSTRPVLVLDRRVLPPDGRELDEALLIARSWVADTYRVPVSAIAMIEPSRDPRFDLDYRSERHGGGHALLAAVAVADRLAWLPRDRPSSRARINVVDTGHRVLCELDRSGTGTGFGLEFAYRRPRRLGDLLPSGSALLPVDGMEVSLVSAGRPYLFVDAADLGVHDQRELFADAFTARLGWRLAQLARAAARLLGPARIGTGLRAAAVGQYQYRRLAVRPLPVPGDRMLTPGDTTTLAAAAAIDGTVPYRLARRGWSRLDELVIDTPAGTTVARLSVSGSGADDTLSRAGVRRSTVRYCGPVVIEPLRHLLGTPDGRLCRRR
ncbi:hypothetical protein ACFV4F_03515 [Kitasatospora sp. NPDC059722]|uniref:hypothetical protein n=1 Tax=Kitasatospora sp. NPDC059722 TaxID=3346925 RepID=UPI0036908CA2